MKTWALLLIPLLAAGLSSPTSAQPDGIEPGTPVAGTPTAERATELIEGWNDDQPYAPSGTYLAECFGFRYVPSVPYILQRVEFHAGGRAGPVTVSLLASDGSGFPTGPPLGTVSYVESEAVGWQGAELQPPVFVDEGTEYFIIYDVVPGADASTAEGGAVITHAWSGDDCTTWDQWWETQYWMARFYGDLNATPTEAVSWGQVKALYR